MATNWSVNPHASVRKQVDDPVDRAGGGRGIGHLHLRFGASLFGCEGEGDVTPADDGHRAAEGNRLLGVSAGRLLGRECGVGLRIGRTQFLRKRDLQHRRVERSRLERRRDAVAGNVDRPRCVGRPADAGGVGPRVWVEHGELIERITQRRERAAVGTQTYTTSCPRLASSTALLPDNPCRKRWDSRRVVRHLLRSPILQLDDFIIIVNCENLANAHWVVEEGWLTEVME